MVEQVQLQNATALLIERFCETAPQSAASRLETVSAEAALEILQQMPLSITAPVWSELSSHTASEMIDALPEDRAKEVLHAIDPAKVAGIIATLGTDKREKLLAKLDQSDAKEVRELMAYPIDSAGRIMDTRVLMFTGDMTIRDAQQVLRARRSNQGMYELRIVDEDKRLLSTVPLSTLALADPAQTLDSISERIRTVVQPTATRDEIIEQMEMHRLEELTVVDHEGKIQGVIRHSTLIDVLKEDVSIDIQTMVGVGKDERATSTSWLAIRKRLPWLQVNLLTAFAAASVVGIFESTIATFTALAVLLPVVAGQSGNAGAQALAVTMRGLALREVKVRDWPKMVRKEGVVGLWNGVAIAVVCGIGVYFWSGSFGLVLVITSSMVLAMVIAGLAGVLVPVGLQRIGQDPAVASSIVLTTITDIAGFFSFLGIATLLSGMLS